MTLLDPFTLGDAGFQLSFAATLGLVIYTRPIQNAVERGLVSLLASGSASGDASYKDSVVGGDSRRRLAKQIGRVAGHEQPIRVRPALAFD